MDTLAVINQKGGVGKSTTAMAIGAGLILKGYSVLFIDLDAQGNLSYSMGADTTGKTALDVLQGLSSPQAAIQKTGQGDIIASSPALAGADTIMTTTGKEYRLKEALDHVRASYDLIIIDTPPALGILTINALTACTGALIPAQADIYSLKGINQLYSTIEAVRRYCNPDLVIKGIVLTRYSPRTVISREVAELIGQTAERLHTKLYSTAIRESTSIKESQAKRQSIFSYAPRSNAAIDYMALVDELIKGE